MAKKPATAARHSGEFESLGENLLAIARAANHGPVDSRLVRAPTGMGETDPGSGGFMIAEQFSGDLIWSAYEAAVAAPLCDRRQTDNPLGTVKFPGIDETSRADGSRWGGARAYWAAEAATIAASLPRFKQLEFSPKKLIAICIGTDELLQDAPLLEAHLRKVFAAEMAFKLDVAIISGSGAGVPQGLLSSSALITVPKQNGQAAATITQGNISAMFKRLPLQSRRRAVWLVHEDVEEQLDTLGPLAAAGFYLPAGIDGNIYPMLKGRPVMAAEQCSPVGTVGDIILADLNHYLIIDGGFTAALSADALFVTDQIVFRFTLRIDGQPAFTSPITPYQGSTTRSPFVALAAR